MSSNETTQPTSEPTARPLNVAAILFVLCALWVVPAAWCGYKLVKNSNAETSETEKDKTEDANPLKSLDPNRSSYVVVLVLAALGGITTLAGGFWTSATRLTIPKETHARNSMIALVVCGVFSGLLLMLISIWFEIDEYELLTNWLTRQETKTKDLWRVLVPAMLFIAGSGLAFFAAQPARRLERNDQTVRRLVYGTNFAVTAILLFASLVIVNGFVALRLPQRLDTTQSGYYSINSKTEELVRTLSEKVTIYNFLFEGRPGSAETRVLLEACQAANPSKFIPRFISRGISTTEIQKIENKFPGVDINSVALIISLGDDETRYSAVRDSDVIRRETAQGAGPPPVFYEGESKLVREILFLYEGKSKSTVYFTQGHGELALAPQGGRPSPPERSAAELKSALEKANLNVEPLPFDVKAPKIPDDASVIVIADPMLPLGKELVDALTKYMTVPNADGKKGKLIVLAAPHPAPVGGGVIATGLDALLQNFNVRLAPAFLLNAPSDQFPADLVLGVASLALQSTGQPVARALPSALRSLIPLSRPRALEIIQPGNPAIQTSALIETIGGEQITWQETDQPTDLNKAFEQLKDRAKVNPQDAVIKKKISADQLPLAVVVTEGETSRMVVVGAGEYFTDAYVRTNRTSPGLGMIVASIDWLRDRPVVDDVSSKQYGFYTPQAKMDRMRLLFLPFGLAVLGIFGLAAGIWVIRRS